MRICLLGKYPPIQGGVSRTTYWSARALADAGHQVHVVTNAWSVEPEYRMYLEPNDLPMLQYDADGPGFVKLVNLDPLGPRPRHIPYARNYVSQLAGAAIREIEQHDLELIYSFYVEPYGMAGHIASLATNAPHVMQHAGSDLNHLMDVGETAGAFGAAFRSAAAIRTNPVSIDRFLECGVSPSQIRYTGGWSAPAGLFSDGVHPLDLCAFFERLRDHDRDFAEEQLRWRSGSFSPDRPTIGVYGKVGTTKGTYDLIAALNELIRDGRDLDFVAMVGGRGLDRVKRTIASTPLAERTSFLPLLPHWRVPSFVRACDAVCFLERGFWLPGHTPTVAEEVLSAGTCLVVSDEVASKMFPAGALRHRRDALVVDPRDRSALTAALRLVVESPAEALEIGRCGMRVFATATSSSAEAYDARLCAQLSDVVARRGRPSRPAVAAPDGLEVLSPGFSISSRPAEAELVAVRVSGEPIASRSSDAASAQRDALAALADFGERFCAAGSSLVAELAWSPGGDVSVARDWVGEARRRLPAARWRLRLGLQGSLEADVRELAGAMGACLLDVDRGLAGAEEDRVLAAVRALSAAGVFIGVITNLGLQPSGAPQLMERFVRSGARAVGLGAVSPDTVSANGVRLLERLLVWRDAGHAVGWCGCPRVYASLASSLGLAARPRVDWRTVWCERELASVREARAVRSFSAEPAVRDHGSHA